MNLRRTPASMVLLAFIATTVACGQASQSGPGGASVVGATPLPPVASEAVIPNPPVPFDTQPSAVPNQAPIPESTPALAPPAPSDSSAVNTCIAATSANLGLATAQDRAAVDVAADQLEKLGPPANVRTAIEYFRNNRGAMFTDPNFATRSEVISDWVEGLCATLTVPNP